MSPEKRNALPFRIAAWAALLVTLGLVIFARIRLVGLPLERDEGEYAYTGQLLLHAIPPYKLAYSMKFPGTGIVYALLMSIFGQSAVGVHIGLIVINLVAAGLIFFLGRNIFGEIPGIAAAATYSVLSLMPYVLGQAAHAAHFVVLFTVAGTLVLIRALDRRSPRLIFTSGCLFGLASMMKQPGLFFVFFGSLYLFSRDWRAQLEAKKILFRNLQFFLGVSVPCFIAGLALWIGGVFGKFWFWTIHYATQYGSRVGLGLGLQILVERFWITIGTAWSIWALAALGLIACLLITPLRTRAGFLVAFAFFSAL